MGALCCVGRGFGALGRVGRGFGSARRAGLGWAWDLAGGLGWAWVWLWWARLGWAGAELAFCVWSTLYMSASCLHDGFLIWLIYLRCLGSMLVSF